MVITKSDEIVVEWLERERVRGYFRFSGISDTEFAREYFCAPWEVQDYLGRYVGRAMVRELGVPGKNIMKAELLPVDDDSAMLSFKAKGVGLVTAMQVADKLERLRKEFHESREKAANYMQEVFDKIKVKKWAKKGG